jgi:NAD(P)-dependent dehydrogenase (short-subunit alcohol dehydrogenase family)
VALVVGGGSGIGREGAIGLADFGALSVVADLNLAGAEETAAGIRARGRRAEARVVDIRDALAVEELVSSVAGRHGGIDVLLSMPAINIRKRALDYTDAELDHVVDLNIKGTFRLARAVGRVMAARGRGSIILMSSMRAVNVEPGQTVYAATKAAIGQMAKGLAVDLAASGVRVNALAPGIIETPLTRPITDKPEWKEAYAARTALGRWGSPTEMVGPIVFLASDAGSYVTATTVFAEAGWTAIDGRFKPPV